MSQARLSLCALTLLAIGSPANGQDVAFRLVAVTSPTNSETVTTLPGSIADICAGDTYYIELWASDVGSINTGVSSAYVDLQWPGAEASVTSINHGTVFDVVPSGTISFGKVDELGGSVLSPTGIAVEPEWTRVAWVEMTAVAEGATAYGLAESATGVAALGRGEIPWNEVALNGVTLTTPWCADALFSCNPLGQSGSINDTVTVEVFVEGVIGLNAYQVNVSTALTSGSGSLIPTQCFVDTSHPLGFLFSGLEHVSSCDPNTLRIAAVASNSETVAVPGGLPAYLGTFALDISDDAANGSVFTVDILSEPDSLLLNPLGETLPFSTAPACTIDVRIPECDYPTAFAEGSRYLQVRLHPSDSTTRQAIRVTSPDCPDLLKYVDSNGCLTADTPEFDTVQGWGLVHIRGEDVVPGFTYDVTALCEDGLTEGGTTLASTWSWGDVNNDAAVDVVDIQKVVQCAEGNFPSGTTIYNADLVPDCSSPECDVFDVVAILDAFRNWPYPGSIPCMPRSRQSSFRETPPGASSLSGSVVTLVPLVPSAQPGSALTVDVFVRNVTDLRAYQIQPLITGGAQGGLACDSLVVDTSRSDYVFYNAGYIAWVNTDLCRVASALEEGGIDVGAAPKYLGTFTLQSSAADCGSFTAHVDATSSFLVDHAGQPLGFVADVVELMVFNLGDANCDGAVDLLDYLEFDGCMSGPDNSTTPNCDLFDVDGDGDIDLADWSAFQVAFSGPLP